MIAGEGYGTRVTGYLWEGLSSLMTPVYHEGQVVCFMYDPLKRHIQSHAEDHLVVDFRQKSVMKRDKAFRLYKTTGEVAHCFASLIRHVSLGPLPKALCADYTGGKGRDS